MTPPTLLNPAEIHAYVAQQLPELLGVSPVACRLLHTLIEETGNVPGKVDQDEHLAYLNALLEQVDRSALKPPAALRALDAGELQRAACELRQGLLGRLLETDTFEQLRRAKHLDWAFAQEFAGESVCTYARAFALACTLLPQLPGAGEQPGRLVIQSARTILSTLLMAISEQAKPRLNDAFQQVLAGPFDLKEYLLTNPDEELKLRCVSTLGLLKGEHFLMVMSELHSALSTYWLLD